MLRTFDEELFNFRAPQATAAFVTFTDSALGGQSTAQVRHSTGECGADAQTSDTGCLVFEGNFSSAIPADAPSEVHRLGQAACQSKVPSHTLLPVLCAWHALMLALLAQHPSRHACGICARKQQ